MHHLKMLLIFTLASICVACGGGSGSNSDEPKTYEAMLGYNDSPTWARFKSFTTSSPSPAGAPNSEQFTVSSGGLPPGLSLNPTTGIISGVPTVAGSYSAMITLTVNGYTGSVSAPFKMTINDLTLEDGEGGVTNMNSIGWKVGSNFLIQAAKLYGGDLPIYADTTNGIQVTYQMAKGSTLPEGLILDPATGILSGVSSVSVGSYPNIQLQAIVTYQGVPYTFTSLPETLNVTTS